MYVLRVGGRVGGEREVGKKPGLHVCSCYFYQQGFGVNIDLKL